MPWAHGFLVITSLSCVFFYGGSVFGWGALSSILAQEGYYGHVCRAASAADPCDEQLEALNDAYTFASSCGMVMAFINGWLVDSLGLTKVTVMSGVLTSLGFLGIILSKPPGSGGMSSTSSFDFFLWFVFWTYTLLGMLSFSLYATAWAMNRQDFEQIVRYVEKKEDDPRSPKFRSRGATLEHKDLWQQLQSWEFIAIFIYSIIQVPRSNMYMGSVQLVNSNIASKIAISGQGLSDQTIADIATFTGDRSECRWIAWLRHAMRLLSNMNRNIWGCQWCSSRLQFY
eukprot:Skav209574  [mRNA]  locus=scaffold281:170592:173761:- [translate_table: standard]